MALEWMQNLPASLRAGFVLWGLSLGLFVWIIVEENSGVEVHQSRSKITPSGFGYWGKPSANIDWCEDNYAVSPYIAEFFNALSSTSYLITSVIGAWFTLKYKLEQRFLVCFTSIFLMGIGSIAFHATLLRTTQILDEIPLIFSALTFIYILSTMQDEVYEKDPELREWKNRKLSCLLIAIGTNLCGILHFPREPSHSASRICWTGVLCHLGHLQHLYEIPSGCQIS